MQHWHTAVRRADALLDVAYERVVDDLEGEARRLIAFCGLPWDERCLTFHENRRPIATPSNVQARQPLYGGSVARWRADEAYLSPRSWRSWRRCWPGPIQSGSERRRLTSRTPAARAPCRDVDAAKQSRNRAGNIVDHARSGQAVRKCPPAIQRPFLATST